MTGPDDERAKPGSGRFEDSVTLEISDLDRGVFALFRLTRGDGGNRGSAVALGCLGPGDVTVVDESPGGATIPEWDEAQVTGLRMAIVEPLARWRCSFEHDACRLEADVEAVSAPIEAEARYEQLCRVRGVLDASGTQIEVDGVGRRTRAWGDPSGDRVRSLYAIAGDRAVTATAIRPAGSSEAHGAELVAAHMLRPGETPEPFEETRLSTIYDGDGRPRTAGMELYVAGDEYPRRLSGEAVCRASAQARRVLSSGFRWSVDGEPAQGGYHVMAAA